MCRLIDDGLVVVVEPLTEREKEEAERVAKRIAADPTSGDPDGRSHLPEAEAMVLMQRRASFMVEQILLDEKAARNVAQELGLRFTGFPGVLGRAALDGWVTQDKIRQLLKTCHQQGTHYSESLIETVAQTYGKRVLMKTVPEPDAELLSAEDVHRDVASLTKALERRRAERRAYEILERPDVREMLDKLIASGVCAEEAIESALKTLATTGMR